MNYLSMQLNKLDYHQKIDFNSEMEIRIETDVCLFVI